MLSVGKSAHPSRPGRFHVLTSPKTSMWFPLNPDPSNEAVLEKAREAGVKSKPVIFILWSDSAQGNWMSLLFAGRHLTFHPTGLCGS